MQYHLILTEECNKHCTYCGGTRHINGIPLNISYPIEDLINFLKKEGLSLEDDMLHTSMDEVERLLETIRELESELEPSHQCEN